jgi:hypothetical protein
MSIHGCWEQKYGHLARAKSTQRFDGWKVQVKILWYGLPYWPFEVSGTIYREAFRRRDRDLGILLYSRVLDYDPVSDVVLLGRLPWWKAKESEGGRE